MRFVQEFYYYYYCIFSFFFFLVFWSVAVLKVRRKCSIVKLVAYSVFFEEGCEQNYWDFQIYYLTCYQLNSNRTGLDWIGVGIYIFVKKSITTYKFHMIRDCCRVQILQIQLTWWFDGCLSWCYVFGINFELSIEH